MYRSILAIAFLFLCASTMAEELQVVTVDFSGNTARVSAVDGTSIHFVKVVTDAVQALDQSIQIDIESIPWSIMVSDYLVKTEEQNTIRVCIFSSQALSKLRFVEYASISFCIEIEETGFGRDRTKAVSVFVMPKEGSLTEQQKQNIVQLVQHSFADLKGNDISLMDLGSDGSTMAGFSSVQNAAQQQNAIRKHQEEEKIKNKAIEVLNDFGDVRVAVNVELE